MHRFVAVAALLVLASGCASHRLEEHKILYMAIGASDALGIGATPRLCIPDQR